MTLFEFLADLRETKTKCEWRSQLNYIRTQKDECPIEAVAAAKDGSSWSGRYLEAASFLGLGEIARNEIVKAADKAERHDPELRDQLLKATGLA